MTDKHKAERVVACVNDMMRLSGFESDDELTERLMAIAVGELSVAEAEQDLLARLKRQYPHAFKPRCKIGFMRCFRKRGPRPLP